MNAILPNTPLKTMNSASFALQPHPVQLKLTATDPQEASVRNFLAAWHKVMNRDRVDLA